MSNTKIGDVKMSNVTTKNTAYVSYYSGYRHNRYDGYQCSWGVLAALGASPVADCFADSDDYPDSDFDKKWNGDDEKFQINEIDFQKSVLSNLDLSKYDINEIKNLEVGETFEHTEFWGEEINIKFTNIGGEIICKFDEYETFICEF